MESQRQRVPRRGIEDFSGPQHTLPTGVTVLRSTPHTYLLLSLLVLYCRTAPVCQVCNLVCNDTLFVSYDVGRCNHYLNRLGHLFEAFLINNHWQSRRNILSRRIHDLILYRWSPRLMPQVLNGSLSPGDSRKSTTILETSCTYMRTPTAPHV